MVDFIGLSRAYLRVGIGVGETSAWVSAAIIGGNTGHVRFELSDNQIVG